MVPITGSYFLMTKYCWFEMEEKEDRLLLMIKRSCFRFQLMSLGYHSLVRRYRLLNLKYFSALKLTFMHIVHSKAMLPVSKILEILQIYRGYIWPVLKAVS